MITEESDDPQGHLCPMCGSRDTYELGEMAHHVAVRCRDCGYTWHAPGWTIPFKQDEEEEDDL